MNFPRHSLPFLEPAFLPRWVVVLSAWVLLTLLAARAAESPERPPNILCILADDMSPDDLAVLGNRQAVTPNLDALARRSVVFSEFSVTPLCAPTRASLLTGRHFLRTGVSHVHGGKDHLHRDERTIADVLRGAGYATGMWGKWHSGKAEGYLAHERGFDEALSLVPLYRHRNPTGELNGKLVSFQGWADEIIVDHAIAFMRRNRDRPWLAYVAAMTPHSPEDAPEAWVERFRQKGFSERIAKTHAMVSFLDEQIGRLLGALRAEKLEENTVVLFLSDNGPPAFIEEFSDEERAARNGSGRRGWKGDLWQNGVKAPLFVSRAGAFQPAVVDVPVDVLDVFPTLVELAGVSMPALHPTLDGRSFVAALRGRGSEMEVVPIFQYANPGWGTKTTKHNQVGIRDEYGPVPRETLATLDVRAQVLSVRRGRWKLLTNPENNLGGGERDDVRLVDLERDPLEKENVAAAHPALTQELLGLLHAWWRGIVAEPHAFEPPTFDFPGKQGGAVAIFGRAPLRTSAGLQNTTMVLRQWSTAGQFAEYRIAVNSPGEYRVALKWNDAATVAGGKFTIAVGDRRAVIEVPESANRGAGKIAGQSIALVPGDATLRLEFATVPSAPIPAPGGALVEIVLTPLADSN